MQKSVLVILAAITSVGSLGCESPTTLNAIDSEGTLSQAGNTEENPSSGENNEENPSSGENNEENPSSGENTEENPSSGENTEENPSSGENTEENPSSGENTEGNPSSGENTEGTGSTEDEVIGAPVTCGDVTCPAANPCITMNCVDGSCIESPNTGGSCEDSNPCTEGEVCDETGTCGGGTALPCESPSNPCSIATCDPEVGCTVESAPDGTACDDASLCTQDDTCMGGTCGGTDIPCLPSDIPCQGADACDPATGACSYSPVNEGPCDDQNPCTTQDSCSDNGCAGTPLIACFYEAAPLTDSCYEGILGMERKLDALNELNMIRGIHGLSPVVYNPAYDVAVQKSALMMSVNSGLSHTPPSSWQCWSQEGYDMAETSNLMIRWASSGQELTPPEEEIRGWMIDDNVVSLGHRRWLMDPFLSEISFGSVGGAPLVSSNWSWSQASIIRVIGDTYADLSGQTVPQVIAYPMGNYPAEYMENAWYLSASILTNTGDPWANQNVSYANTVIGLDGPSGPLNIVDQSANNDAYGLPNHIQWRAPQIKAGVEYTVTLSNVEINGSLESFNYTFVLN